MRVITILIAFYIFPLFLQAGNFDFGADIAYRRGLSFQIDGTLSKISRALPFKLRIAAAYTSLDPGNPAAARRIFINNATNGTPEEEGWMWDVRFDVLYRVDWFSLKDAWLFAGPRYSWFTGRFDFVGGNEDFDIYCDQWGIGAGLQSNYPVSKKLNLVLSAGLDYYITDYLHGHDTTYHSNGEIYNGRENYNFKDADEAINQPTFVPKVAIGFSYLLY
ncbi:MAG TPA: hypothetical protein ENJ15_04990 [Caldithrix abyssi]|uniref:DUF3575 domain-containing protein n=1 Tax=Caldithrix abyssi TaxID=187145 RepID=A0A7V5VF46_CALAY|nr:hypothetical protein [Caldithrix abyssi]